MAQCSCNMCAMSLTVPVSTGHVHQHGYQCFPAPLGHIPQWNWHYPEVEATPAFTDSSFNSWFEQPLVAQAKETPVWETGCQTSMTPQSFCPPEYSWSQVDASGTVIKPTWEFFVQNDPMHHCSAPPSCGLDASIVPKLVCSTTPKGKCIDGEGYFCELCGQKLTRKCNLSRHMRTRHSGAKPFECFRCRKQFNRSDHLRVHYKNVHNIAMPGRITRKNPLSMIPPSDRQ